jgi:hypothetical protein
MRELFAFELDRVGGGGHSPSSPCAPSAPSAPKKRKNNNGFGNGPESGPAPGRSGTNNSPSASDKQNNRGR